MQTDGTGAGALNAFDLCCMGDVSGGDARTVCRAAGAERRSGTAADVSLQVAAGIHAWVLARLDRR